MIPKGSSYAAVLNDQPVVPTPAQRLQNDQLTDSPVLERMLHAFELMQSSIAAQNPLLMQIVAQNQRILKSIVRQNIPTSEDASLCSLPTSITNHAPSLPGIPPASPKNVEGRTAARQPLPSGWISCCEMLSRYVLRPILCQLCHLRQPTQHLQPH